MNKKYYTPLPDGLTIKESSIHGLGLYATQIIKSGTRLGRTHIKTEDKNFEDGYIRTPLGGFFNHSKTPNCKVSHEGIYIYLDTISDISPEEELTATYTLYDPENHPQSLGAYDFLEIIKKECNQLGVVSLFPETNKVDYPGDSNIKVSGFFDDKIGPTLACAIGKPESDWFEILVHESCHMDQWAEKDPLWAKQIAGGIDCDKGMDEWLGGKEFHIDEYTYFVRTMQELEIDCEKRSVAKILDLGLSIDTKRYIKRANSYLFFYSIMLHTHKWCDISPYDVPEIVEQMPDFFLETKDYFNVTEGLLWLYEKCYTSI